MPVDQPEPPYPAAPTIQDALTILEEAVAGSHNTDTSDETFAAKYAGLSIDQLRVAQVAVSTHAQAESERISAELMAAGRFESQLVEEGSLAQMPQTSRGEPVVSFGFNIEPGDGFSTVKIAKIDPAEFPEFHALQMEARWLESQILHADRKRE
ncbi:MAG: hypothetical protein L6Q99_04655 [Planctomycetes bacterium]|nr:hypothetical protein [Planctomycetota bacterium]